MIYYEDFGAVGDGVTNDFSAIRKAHEAANERGEKISAAAGKCYYLKMTEGSPIVIKTDVSWHGASFIIDDTTLSFADPETYPACDVFRVENDYPIVELDAENPYIKAANAHSPAIEKNGKTKKLDLGLGYPALLVVYNDENTQYIRCGFKDRGSPQKELFLIDEYGNIDEKTPALFDYEKITRISVIRCDTKPISVEGGEITTLASQVYNETENYREVEHGFEIARPNTTVVGLKHYIKNQILKGEIINGKAFYGDSAGGFYKAHFTTNVEFRNCFATPRIMYGASYEIMVGFANDVRFIGVYESEESYNDTRYWWIMGSNFSKNITYDSCYLSRFDAHCGVYNATIKNSTVASLRLTGGGDFIIENSTVKTKHYGTDTFIMLREDYGSTWRGNIYIKNCLFDNITESRRLECVKLIWAEWRNHDFGYRTFMPNIFVDNLKIAERLCAKRVELFSVANKDGDFKDVTNFALTGFSGEENKNIYNPPEFVSVKNCDTGISFVMPSGDFYKRTKLEKD